VQRGSLFFNPTLQASAFDTIHMPISDDFKERPRMWNGQTLIRVLPNVAHVQVGCVEATYGLYVDAVAPSVLVNQRDRTPASRHDSIVGE